MTVHTSRCANRKCRKSRRNERHLPDAGIGIPCPHCGSTSGWRDEITNPKSRKERGKIDLTYDIARVMFLYDYETGVVSRRVAAGNQSAGSVCASDKGNGYLQLEFGGSNYLLHRVVWLLCTGAWPSEHIDHIDGDSYNNRASNLRDVSQRINCENHKAAYATNQLGILGVTCDANTGRFISRISVCKKTYQLGTFATPEEAHANYLDAKRLFHEGNTL